MRIFAGKLFVRWSDEERLAVESQLTDDRVSRSLLDADDSAFRAAARSCERDFDLAPCRRSLPEPVIDGGMKMSLSRPSIFLLRDDEAVPVAMQDDRSVDQISRELAS